MLSLTLKRVTDANVALNVRACVSFILRTHTTFLLVNVSILLIFSRLRTHLNSFVESRTRHAVGTLFLDGILTTVLADLILRALISMRRGSMKSFSIL